jgi:hypothetical protein
VQDKQQMLKGVVSFIIPIKLPRHVSSANCHHQPSSSASHRGFHGGWPHQANHNPHPPEAQVKMFIIQSKCMNLALNKSRSLSSTTIAIHYPFIV